MNLWTEGRREGDREGKRKKEYGREGKESQGVRERWEYGVAEREVREGKGRQEQGKESYRSECEVEIEWKKVEIETKGRKKRKK